MRNAIGEDSLSALVVVGRRELPAGRSPGSARGSPRPLSLACYNAATAERPPSDRSRSDLPLNVRHWMTDLPFPDRVNQLRQRWDADPSSRLFLQLAEEYRHLGRLKEALGCWTPA